MERANSLVVYCFKWYRCRRGDTRLDVRQTPGVNTRVKYSSTIHTVLCSMMHSLSFCFFRSYLAMQIHDKQIVGMQHAAASSTRVPSSISVFINRGNNASVHNCEINFLNSMTSISLLWSLSIFWNTFLTSFGSICRSSTAR